MRSEAFEKALRNRGKHRRAKEAEDLLFQESIANDQIIECTTEIVAKTVIMLLTLWYLFMVALYDDLPSRREMLHVSRGDAEVLQCEGSPCTGLCSVEDRASGGLDVVPSAVLLNNGDMLIEAVSKVGLTGALRLTVEMQSGNIQSALPSDPFDLHGPACHLTAASTSRWNVAVSACDVRHSLVVSKEELLREGHFFRFSAEVFEWSIESPSAPPSQAAVVVYDVPC
eukprot:TRINITY_DN37350_c0_g1_i1.p1 TRINITY_DN37350_c0_g1~~TRINITY_DN37350_c0_g1_i1.p1  ORF type:complete len:227 (+),score=29.17 TRINITY_DN37350_c0_g1_i1:49-729(+)